MNKLFFDTETSGFPSKKLPKGHPDQAWIVQIGFLFEVDEKILNQGCFLIQADGRTIHPGAQKVHNISAETTEQYGISDQIIADIMSYYLRKSDFVIGHNISFDLQMLEMLFMRSGYLISEEVFQKIPTVCTMRASTDFCKLPGKYGYKWPKLTELYDYLYQKEFPAHDALADIQATYRCYKTLVEKGVI